MPQEYFRALRDVALAINASLDPKDVLHKISEHTAQTKNCKACTIRLLDSTGHFLLPSAAYGLSATYMRKGPVEVKRSGLDSEVLSGKAIHLKDATSDGRFQYPESAKAEGLVSVLSAPLSVGGKVIGLIRVYSSEEREFTDDEDSFMMAVAAISAVGAATGHIFFPVERHGAVAAVPGLDCYFRNVHKHVRFLRGPLFQKLSINIV